MKILYGAQYKEKINPIYDVNNFIEYVVDKHSGFVHFFNTLVQSTNIKKKLWHYFTN